MKNYKERKINIAMHSLQEMNSCLSEYNQRKARDEAPKVLTVAKKQNRPIIFIPQGIDGKRLKEKLKTIKK